MKLTRWIIVILLIGSGWLAFQSGRGLYADYQARTCQAQSVTIEKGSSFQQIVQQLSERGLITNPMLFRWVARYRGVDTQLKAGRYRFETGMTMNDILDQLIAGRTVVKILTIPEGLTIRRIAELLTEVDLSPQKFLEADGDSQFAAIFHLPHNSFEGYLFPETYYLNDETTERDLIRLMLLQFQANFSGEYRLRADRLGFSVHEIVTLASIIESEAQIHEERPIISAVYHNRLQKGMLLQADPTVQYAHGGWKTRLYYKDLEIDSPYNTYRYPGLPPGPISNPGASSIHAALYPADNSYLYFVAKGDGSHLFSKTNAQHNRAKQSVKRGER